MITKASMYMPAAVLIFFAIDVLLPVAYLTNAALAEPLGTQFSILIDLNGEKNLPTWYSSVKLFLIGYLLLMNATPLIERKSKCMFAVVLLGSIFLFMSMDESVEIHERIGHASDVFLPGQDRMNSIFPETGIWMFILLIPAFVLMLYLLRTLRVHVIPANVYRLFVTGLLIFVVSAGGIELLANYYYRDGVTARLLVSAEEFGELIGVTIMLLATYRWLGDPVSFSEISPSREKQQ